MEKQNKTKEKRIKVCFAELCANSILLEIVNFHKCIGNLVNNITKCSQTKINKRKGDGVATKHVAYDKAYTTYYISSFASK